MNYIFFIYVGIFIHPYLSATITAQHKSNTTKIIILEQGENIKLPSHKSEKIWLSNAHIVSIQDHESAINIQAKKLGEVLLNLGSRLYQFQVLDSKTKKNLLAINQFLSHRMGLKAHVVKKQFHISGRLYRVKDFIDFIKIARSLNLNYLFKAEVEPIIRENIQTHIYKQISHRHHSLLPFVLLWTKPLTAVLNNKNSLSYVDTQKLKKLGIKILYNASVLPNLPLIELKILVIESSKNYSFKNQLNWGKQVINTILTGNIFRQLISEFKTMENSGKAKILSETSLLSESGKKLSFHSGGEVPIPIFNPKTETKSIKWKPYGIQISFIATANFKNKIHLNTTVNISEVNHSYSMSAAPSIKKNRITSSVTIQNGQSILLSKMIRTQSGKNHSSPFMLSRLPITSWLAFKGKIKESTKLNIFITAKIKK